MTILELFSFFVLNEISGPIKNWFGQIVAGGVLLLCFPNYINSAIYLF